jgi:hypothetical protein
MFGHGNRRRHTVELLELFTIDNHKISTALRVRCKHAASHDKVSASTEGLGKIARASASTITDDVPLQASKADYNMRKCKN